MTISSPAFTDNSLVPVQYTCMGSNISPPLELKDMPPGAKSLVLIVEDVDASPEPWVHWLVFNIPPKTLTVEEGSLPEGGTEGHANGGTPGYEGPCPKYFKGLHHYHFKLLALNSMIDVPPTADKNAVLKAAKKTVLEESRMVGLCQGQKT